jgi:hypothetical protein
MENFSWLQVLCNRQYVGFFIGNEKNGGVDKILSIFEIFMRKLDAL